MEMTLPPDAFLIRIQTPLEPVPFSVFEIANFGEIRESAFVGPPEVEARTMLHGVGAQERAVVGPLPGCPMGKTIGIRLGGKQLSRNLRSVLYSVSHTIFKRQLEFQLACFMKA